MPDDRPPRGSTESLPGARPSYARATSPEALRTLPLEEGNRLRDELHATLHDARRPTVVVMAGRELGLRKRIQGNALLGRDPANEIVLTDAGVSWRHCRIEDRGDAWALVDLGSTNGTTVNGQRRAEILLADGDRLVLGRTVLRFELRDPVDQAYDEHLQRLLNVDDLSGLYVRRRFDQELATLIQAARGHDGVVGMLVMDMDGVKAINDAHGHLYGAYAIGESGRLIGRVLGARGIGARFGGDEFCAALPGLDARSAAAVAEEVRAAVASHHYVREGVTLRPSISIGVAAFPADAADPVALFQRADEALYRAKQGGRNRVAR